jgi:hypothetical protein
MLSNFGLCGDSECLRTSRGGCEEPFKKMKSLSSHTFTEVVPPTV